MISTAIYIELGGERWRCVRTPDGRTSVAIGCQHLNPRQAQDHAHAMASAAGTTPLRVPAMRSDANTGSLSVGVERIAGAREDTPASDVGEWDRSLGLG